MKPAERDKIAAVADLALRWLLGLTFIVAGGYKLSAPETFAQILVSYELLPRAVIPAFVVFLPCLELVAGAALLAGVLPRAAALLINAMLVVFIAAIGINLLRGHNFECGCFPTVMKSIYAGSPFGMLVRDVVLLLMGVWVMVYRGPRRWVAGGLPH